MEFAERIYFVALHWQNVARRYRRLIFPSPAEMRLIEIMGGKVVRLAWLRDPRTKFPLAIVINKGRIFRREKIKREAKYGRYWVDFANDINRIIEVDGNAYHMDVVADWDREIAIKEMCLAQKMEARFLRIKADELYRDTWRVQQKVLAFLL